MSTHGHRLLLSSFLKSWNKFRLLAFWPPTKCHQRYQVPKMEVINHRNISCMYTVYTAYGYGNFPTPKIAGVLWFRVPHWIFLVKMVKVWMLQVHRHSLNTIGALTKMRVIPAMPGFFLVRLRTVKLGWKLWCTQSLNGDLATPDNLHWSVQI